MITIKKYEGSIIPFSSKSNKYISLIKKTLKLSEFELNEYSKVQLILKKTDFLVLNWVESQIINDRIIVSMIKFVSLYIYIVVLSLRTNIIWTMHNKRPHGSKGIEYFLSKKIMNLLAVKSKSIIIHSEESRKFLTQKSRIADKVIYLPHPNYCNCYGDILSNETNDTTLNLVFFGAINEYKNLDILIEIVKELDRFPIDLKIYGNGNFDIIDNLKKKIEKSTNITGIFRFIEDDEIPLIFSNAHIIVTPYDLNSSLNSGTNILAFSYAKTILGPYNGTLKDMDKINEYFFAYDYETKEEHKEKLMEKILFILNKYDRNFNELNHLGEKCYEYVQENNNITKISEIFKAKLLLKNIW